MLATIGVSVVMGVLIVLAVNFSGQSGQLTRALATQASNQASSAKAIARAQAAERAQTITRECNAEDRRHVNTVRRLRQQRTESKSRKSRRLIAQELQVLGLTHVNRRAFARLLARETAAAYSQELGIVDALAPYQDCHRVLVQSTTPPAHR